LYFHNFSDDTVLVFFNPVFDNGPTGWGYHRVKDYWQDISPLHNIKANTPHAIQKKRGLHTKLIGTGRR
jgi:hypothetical protein